MSGPLLRPAGCLARTRATSESPAVAFGVPGGGSSAVTVIETSTTAILPSTGVLVSQAAHSPSAGKPTRSSGTRAISWNVSRVTLTPLITTSALRPPPSPAHLGLRLSLLTMQDARGAKIVRTSSLRAGGASPEDWLMQDFQSFYERATGRRPYMYEARIARDGLPALVRAPATGAGPTGVILAWLWRRLYGQDPAVTPRRLVYALPQRAVLDDVAGPW